MFEKSLAAVEHGLPRWRAARPMPAPIDPPPPYAVLPVDESMSCSGIAASFRYAARRAARLEYWLSVGPLAGYGYERYPLDAPKQLIDERRRLDALSDLQRYKGCTVMEPGPAVVEERLKLEGSSPATSAGCLEFEGLIAKLRCCLRRVSARDRVANSQAVAQTGRPTFLPRR